MSAAKFPIVDVGAHAGFFSLYARTLNPNVPIFALEPEPQNILALTKTIADNALSNIQVVPKALYSQTGRANLIVTADTHNHYLERPFKNDGHKIRVATTTLADLRATHDIKKIALLKMDIEGGEYAIFESMSDEDFASVQAIILEYHNTKSKTYKIIETLLREQGFSVEIFPSKFEKTMGFLFAQNKRK
jgi:FkbM family methyltransferase